VTRRQLRHRRRRHGLHDVPDLVTARQPETTRSHPRVGRCRYRSHTDHGPGTHLPARHGHRRDRPDPASTHRGPAHDPAPAHGPDRHSRGRYRSRWRRYRTGDRHTHRRPAADGAAPSVAGKRHAAAARPDRPAHGRPADPGRRGRVRDPGTAPHHRGRRTRNPGTSRDRRSSGQNPSTRASGRRQNRSATPLTSCPLSGRRVSYAGCRNVNTQTSKGSRGRLTDRRSCAFH
jgi:hypothetical protein